MKKKGIIKNIISLPVIFACWFFLVNTVQAQQAIPQGKLDSFDFTESRIFPGTERRVHVYIPVQLDTSKPACLYIQQDGYNPLHALNKILDTLIAHKEIPALVAIFIKPGTVPPADPATLRRPNRGYEYDGMGDAYARFLLDEIIPYTVKKYHLNLSRDGKDHAIGGGSSGGISAFNVAWERPEAFTRVYCASGSFVSFRGGDIFPELVRKTDPKPIRVYMSTGTNDMENCAGDWTLKDLEMDKALKFSGYDHRFNLLQGGHGVGWKQYFADAMRYLWQGWPAAVKPGTGAPRMQDILLPGEDWQLVKEGWANATGPACSPEGELFFADPVAGKIYRINKDGKIGIFISGAGHCNALSFGPGGELYAASESTGRIICYDKNGKGKLYAKDIPAKYILAKPDGGLYVSAPPFAGKPSGTWLVRDNRKTLVDTGLKEATGITMSPDQWMLAVADGQSHWVYNYAIGKDGRLENKENFFWLHVRDSDDESGAAAVCYDKEGHLYVATRSGIQVCAWDGPVQVILPFPGHERVTAICFGGMDRDVLYAFCEGKIYKRKMNAHGLGAFDPFIKMTRGKL